MTNPYRTYKAAYIANLPSGVTYDSGTDRFDINNRSFYTIEEVEWYRRYITNFGFSAGFDPASLFASGEEGIWLDIHPDYCFQDDAGTTPAGVGDPVGYVTDRSGNGNHATQSTTAAKPTLRQTGGGLYYLEFDGVDDYLEMPWAITMTEQTTCAGFSFTTTKSFARVFAQSDAGDDFDNTGHYIPLLRDATTDNIASFADSNSRASVSITQPGENIATSIHTGSQIQNSANGGIASTYTHTLSKTWTRALIGIDTTFVTGQHEGNIYSVVSLDRAVTTSEKSDLETYVADKTGITL